MQTHLISSRDIKPGDRLHYLKPEVLVVERVTAEMRDRREYVCLHHATGIHRVNVFGHVHREGPAAGAVAP
jgi:hypothetical protein